MVNQKKLPKNTALAFFFIILTYIIWAAAGPVIKLTISEIPLYTFLFLRFFVVCSLLLPFMIIELRKNPVMKEDYINLLALGITGQVSLVLVFAGLQYTTALEASFIGLIAPLLTIYAGHYFYNERIDKRIFTGILVSLAGTVLIALEPLLVSNTSDVSTSTRMLGNLLTISYYLVFLLYTLISKMDLSKRKSQKLVSFLHSIRINSTKKHYSTFITTGITFYVALAFFAPLAVLENYGLIGNYNGFVIQNISISAFLGVLYMAVISSIVAYSAYEWALKFVDIKDTAIIVHLTPLFTLPFAFILLNEIPTNITIIGGLIIAVGVYIAETKKS